MTLTQESNKKPFRICSINGGGIRGILPSLILVRLEEITGKHSTELFDLFIGTSTGALVAAILNTPSKKDSEHPWKYTAKDLLDVYVKEAIYTFQSSMWRKVTSMNGITGPLYYTKNRDERFNVWLGDVRLKETLKDVVFTSFEMCTKSPVLFKTFKAKSDEKDDHSLQDVVKSATAAPTVWDPHEFDKKVFHDALYAKSPAMYGVVEALQNYDADLGNIQILSLGTGFVKSQLEAKKITKSGMSFLSEVVNSTINAHTKDISHMIETIFKSFEKSTGKKGSTIVELDVELTDSRMTICDVSKENIEYLLNTGRQYIIDNDDKIRKFAEMLIFPEKLPNAPAKAIDKVIEHEKTEMMPMKFSKDIKMNNVEKQEEQETQEIISTCLFPEIKLF